MNNPATAEDRVEALVKAPVERGINPDREYDVVALSFPIVYSLEGDHDPNGMLYTLRVYKPLLDWAKRQWEDNDEYLPKMHRKCQLMEVVADGIPRYKRMREILEQGPVGNHYLLQELGGESEVLDREIRDAHRPTPTPEQRAVRQNYRATVDELVTALRELTRGSVTHLSIDPQVLDGWRTKWLAQLEDAQRAVEKALLAVDARLKDELRRYAPDHGVLQERRDTALQERRKEAGAAEGSAEDTELPRNCHDPLVEFTREEIERLLCNDHLPVEEAGAGQGQISKPTRYHRFNPLRPIPLVRPLVLRATLGQTVQVHFENEIRSRKVGMHVQLDRLGGQANAAGPGSWGLHSDGAHVGKNRASVVGYQQRWDYTWEATREGVWPINDLGDVRGTDRGTNNHGLFAALVVEPEGAQWYDPETGCRLDNTCHPDGLYVDVVPIDEHGLNDAQAAEQHPVEFVDFHTRDQKNCSFREFAVFFHDEPETHSAIPHPLPHSAMPLSYRAEPMHNRLPYRLRKRWREAEQKKRTKQAKNLDLRDRGIDHSAVEITLDHLLGEEFWVAKDTTDPFFEDHDDLPLYADARKKGFLERVSGEEQHHSSWLFGEPVTPILRAYKGDPCRVRLVHAGVKETHVFHLHVHQWRAVAQDVAKPSAWQPGEHHGSQLLDSISIGPQTGMTIDPLYGSGSRQHAVGDIIWHCHLYPHFHHGMWGLWRSFDRLIGKNHDPYPDGTPCFELQPLPGRQPAEDRPGFPWFIDYRYPRKSPPPPAPSEADAPNFLVDGRRQLLRLGRSRDMERNAFDPACADGSQPGALFVDLDGQAEGWNRQAPQLPEQRIIRYDIEVTSRPMTYNSSGWHDPMGHYYRLTGASVRDAGAPPPDAASPPSLPLPVSSAKDEVEPLFLRANHGDVVELRLHNLLGTSGIDHFDFPGHPVECGLHVHLVKFDVLAADGSASGWNYLSGASSPEAVGPNIPGKPDRNVSLHRWVVDEEFGPCFFHDHLLANFRQKRGLFAALVAEPQGSRWYLPDQKTVAWTGSQAVVVPSARHNKAKVKGDSPAVRLTPYREACLALGDFVPLQRRNGEPLNEPHLLGGDDDPGVMGVNYRCTPMEQRGKDPSEWFSSRRSQLKNAGNPRAPLDVTGTSPRIPVPLKEAGDPDTPVLYTYPGERLRIRLFQGSHEEQHSFMLNGMRWRKDWYNRTSPLVNQQTIGISEAFTVDINPDDASPYGLGDFLWQFTVMDDLWLGCWGLIRSLETGEANFEALPPLPLECLDLARPEEDVETWAKPLRKACEEAKERRRTAHEDIPQRTLGIGTLDEDTGLPRLLTTDQCGELNIRQYVIAAQRHEHLYAGPALTDPWGLIYRNAEDVVPDGDGSTGHLRAVMATDEHGRPKLSDEPLVLRAHPGEWLRVILVNEVLLPDDGGQRGLVTRDRELPPFGPEVSPPRLPVEHRDHLGYPDRRTVSPRVALHPSLLQYDVVRHDGSWVGRNHDSTVAALDMDDTANVVHGAHDPAAAVTHRTDHAIGHRAPNWREYWWYVDDKLAPAGGVTPRPGQACYLFDMGDIRNHRHHGLIGAVVVEPQSVTPMDPDAEGQEKWVGPHVRLHDKNAAVAEEHVLFLQDGLRHFLRGDIDQPVPDVSPSDPPVDVGQKAISYRSPLTPTKDPLAWSGHPTPVIRADEQLPVWLHLVCAGDKPRNHTFTLHGFVWNAAPWVQKGPHTGGMGAISAGFAQDLVLLPDETGNKRPWDKGDHAYRSGAFRWAVAQGMWGILRVGEPPQAP